MYLYPPQGWYIRWAKGRAMLGGQLVMGAAPVVHGANNSSNSRQLWVKAATFSFRGQCSKKK